MSDSQTTVTNLDIQLLDAERSNTVTIKLDNPKNDVTREQVSSAMQTPLNNGWFLNSKGDTLMYLGDVTINQSIKTKLGGEDFYVTPSSVDTNAVKGIPFETTITVSGATIQGYNFANVVTDTGSDPQLMGTIAANGLSILITIRVNVGANVGTTLTCDLQLIILGAVVTVPVKITIVND